MLASRTPESRSRQVLTSAARLALTPLALVALGACAGQTSTTLVNDVTAGPVDVAGSTTSTSTATSSGSGSATSASSGTATGTASGSATTSPGSTGSACTTETATIPAGADSAQAGDLDGDGAADQVWLADQDGDRLLGVSTAAGGVFSTTFSSASPISATAVGNRLGDGTAIVLLSTGRSAALYAVIDCAVVATQNVNGSQYTFDLGFTGYGTGVACPTTGSGLYLAGYNTTEAEQDGYATITRTRIDLSQDGARADNGTVAELGDYGEDSASYRIAHGVSCGDVGTAQEPAS